MLIVLDGARDHILRYAALARDQAGTQTDAARAGELRAMADGLEWISENPPRTFWEALQLMHLVVCLSYIEGNGQGINYGRFDQLLHPFYERDLQEATAAKHFIAELIECWCIKTWEMLKLRDEVSATLSSEGGYGSTTTVGGVDRSGGRRYQRPQLPPGGSPRPHTTAGAVGRGEMAPEHPLGVQGEGGQRHQAGYGPAQDLQR